MPTPVLAVRSVGWEILGWLLRERGLAWEGVLRLLPATILRLRVSLAITPGPSRVEPAIELSIFRTEGP